MLKLCRESTVISVFRTLLATSNLPYSDRNPKYKGNRCNTYIILHLTQKDTRKSTNINLHY